MIVFLIFIFFFFTFLLIKSADQVVIALRRLSKNTSSKTFVLSATILALATSFPELFVGITSAFSGTPSLSLGNVIGANITNISFVAGLSAFIAGRVSIQGGFLMHEVGVAFIAGILPLILISDGQLSRIDGFVLIAVYLAYATSFFRHRFLEIAEEHKKETFVHRFIREFNHVDSNATHELGRLFVGIAALLFSADLIVRISARLSELVDLPVFLVGLIILSIGTTLPELAFSFRSLKDREPKMYFGNLLGSIIANSTLVIGIVSVISPIKEVQMQKYLLASGSFIVIFVLFWFFIKSKLRLDRWEAGALILLYLIFVLVEFL